jgi:hypothetical protein
MDAVLRDAFEHGSRPSEGSGSGPERLRARVAAGMCLLLVAGLVGCAPAKEDTSTEETAQTETDVDGDGYDAGEDCDDEDASVHPGAEDAPYDGLDADCAEDSDFDADQDGFDAVDHDGNDCNDADPDVNPRADEVCDGIDNDCDGRVDGSDAEDAQTWWLDGDGDGYGDPEAETTSCERPDASVSNDDDCDDTDASVSPEATEIVCNGTDDDCDGAYGDGLATIDGSEWTSLQEAVDALEASGGTVTLCEGTFPAVTIAAGAPLNLVGSTLGSTIDAGGSGSAVWIEDGEVTLDTLELTGGVGTKPSSSYPAMGGGLLVYTEDPVRVVGCRITGNSAEYGGGIFVRRRGTLELVDTEVRGNEAEHGGGLNGDGGNTLVLTGVDIVENRAENGAGIRVESGTVVTADSTTTVRYNEAEESGGGVDASQGLVWTGATISDNVAGLSGGGMEASCADEGITLAEVRFESNEAEVGGGGALDLACSLDGTAVELVDNSAGLDGGALYLSGSGGHVVTLSESVVEGNSTSGLGRGGGAQLDDGQLVSVNTDWGTGATDNDPVDVRLGETLESERPEYDYGANASFHCYVVGGSPYCE